MLKFDKDIDVYEAFYDTKKYLDELYFSVSLSFTGIYIDTLVSESPDTRLNSIPEDMIKYFESPEKKDLKRWLDLYALSYRYLSYVVADGLYKAGKDYDFEEHLEKSYKSYLSSSLKADKEDIKSYIKLKILKEKDIKNIDKLKFESLGSDDYTIADLEKEIKDIQ